jgi:glycosyltransferase involved in cell wall biosynthesis
MKILLFSPTLQMGGAEKIISKFYLFLKKQKIETKIVLFNNKKPYFDYKIEECDIINLNVKRARFSILKIIKIIFREKPNYIFSNQRESNLAVSIANILLLRRFKIIAREAAPFKFSNQNFIDKFYLYILKILYKSFNGIIFNSKYTQKSFLEKFKLKNHKVINNPILVSSIKKNNYRRNDKIRNSIKLLTCSRLHEQKNIFTLINYFRMYKLRNSNAELHIVGDGEQRNEIIKYINKFSLHKNVFIHKSQLNLEKFYLSSDIYISTSLSEGFGNIFLEALYYNLPIISFDNGGVREILKKNFQGRIISQNYFSFINNINFCLKKNFKILYPSISHFNKDNIYKKYLNFIEND